MSIEEIMERLEFAARYIEGNRGKTFLLGDFDVKALRSAIEKLRTQTLSYEVDIQRRANGKIVYCYLYMNANYFTNREAISFNPDGFIGFAGWADVGNKNPLLRAFLKWCDYLAEAKEA